ncbi:T9SS type A sorting domain-containing protein [Hymenobacter sp. BT683]|uniref:T9SS type A sorting domain-containing protein n=1 Tax=Hymenobacter jeongseonensis TaxID=2791027 RepID=A0ABS0II69_9BACT|nr:T9SS type A sorting domain-containing protein [Hymenobacter jeongseonensis]MBF9237500.1 T9SS type A sorting domain-containing protein [Hymenobacter jeongseonensis]
MIRDLKTVSSNIAWAVAEGADEDGRPNAFFVTKNAAGDEFRFGAVSAANGSAGFETANISAVGNSALVAVAATYPPGEAGGEILRTTNGGVSWTKVTTATQFASAQGGFCNFVHMFDANDGVALGDPTANTGYFEILRTTDGGVTWKRNSQANSPVPLPDEFGLVRSFFARGNTIWAGTATPEDVNSPARVLKSTDRGQTWSVSTPTTLLGSINRLAFKDDLNGIAYNLSADNGELTSVNVIRTADGGATWSPITPINTATGSFFWYDIDAVDGRYYSVGTRFPESATSVAEDFGSSYSTDGINWVNLSTGQPFLALDVIAGSGASSVVGYAGAATTEDGSGGIYKASNVLSATRNAALQGALSAYPNPSHSGVFQVSLGSVLKGNAQLSVVDALGRQVRVQALNATAIGSRQVNLDLSGQKAGLYTLQIRTDAGIATKKLVIE